MSRYNGGCIGSLFTLVKIGAAIIVFYIIISFFYNTPSSDRVRSEYVSLKGTFEQIDINNINLATLENQGASSLNTLGAVSAELWDMSYTFVKGLFHKPTLKYLQDGESSSSIPAGWPIDRSSVGSIGSYGIRLHPIKMRFIKHKGIDLSCAMGTPIYATADGVIKISDQGEAKKGYGQMVLITHNGQYKSRYAHLSSRVVSVGQRVQRGQVIGYVGSSGSSTGPHLHYEVLKSDQAVNPMTYINLSTTNGG